MSKTNRERESIYSPEPLIFLTFILRDMHHHILSKEQSELLPLVQKFKKDYCLVGGTAIALHLGHRKSIDFDLFTFKPINKSKISKILSNFNWERRVIANSNDQVHYLINGVKFTFFEFPFIMPCEQKEESFSIPSLLDLASMKAFALGGRAKWKDYVDLYFILKHHFSLKEVSLKTYENFGAGNFSFKLFLEQLTYYKDVDYSEKVEFIDDNEVSSEKIKSFLIKKATKELKLL